MTSAFRTVFELAAMALFLVGVPCGVLTAILIFGG